MVVPHGCPSAEALASYCSDLLLAQEWELLSEVPLMQHKQQPQAAIDAAAALANSQAPSSGLATGQNQQQPGRQQQQQQQEGQAVLAPGSVSISWRGDGRYFATSSLDSSGQLAAA
jgi:hypothetical protein